MQNTGTMNMTTGSVKRVMLAFAMPVFLSQLFQQLYNTADSVIVGNLLGKQALAAVSSSASLIQLLTSLMTETPPAEEEIRLNAWAAARRFHQAVPLPALLRAYRVRERTIWDELVDCADLQDPAQLRVLLRLAGRVMEHVDIMSAAVVQAYVEEQAGLRRNRPNRIPKKCC